MYEKYITYTHTHVINDRKDNQNKKIQIYINDNLQKIICDELYCQRMDSNTKASQVIVQK